MRHSHFLPYLAFAGVLLTFDLTAAAVDAETQWQAYGGSHSLDAEVARHETGAVAVGSDIYLIGGRRNRPTLKFDSVSGSWSNLGLVPESVGSSETIELHHFQPVAIGSKIYVLGSMFGGGFPDELSDPNVRVYDTVSSQWSISGQIPTERLRGSAAAVVRDGKIYLLGGNTQGHNGGAVAWLDSYDPATAQWQTLADAPNARDHFAAVIVNDKLVAAGGRQSEIGPGNLLFTSTVASTDVYDFVTGVWTSGEDIPTERAGGVVAMAGNELLIAGGESGDSEVALSTVEAYDVVNDSWRALQDMNTGRHSGGAAVIGSVWHVFSGSVTRGGGQENETSLHETLDLDVPPDSDNDGLSDEEETNVYNTNPTDADTDGDNLFDGPEVNEYASDPLLADTDGDLIPDGEEVSTWQSSPIVADTDSDLLDDGVEVNDWLTSPTLADTDADNLDDYEELVAGTDPLDPDTDGDGLLDGEDSSPLSGSKSGGSMALWLLAILGLHLVLGHRVFRQ